jgi:hypothetical protein
MSRDEVLGSLRESRRTAATVNRREDRAHFLVFAFAARPLDSRGQRVSQYDNFALAATTANISSLTP